MTEYGEYFMLFTSEMIQEYEEQYNGQLPGAALHLLIDTITNFLDTAFDLYLKYPEEMRHSILAIRNECFAFNQNKSKSYEFDLIKDSLYDLDRENKDSILKNFLKNSYKVRQIASSDLDSLELSKIHVYLNSTQKQEASRISLHFLDLTLQKLNELDNEKSPLATARLSNSSNERNSFDTRSSCVLFHEPSEKNKKTSNKKVCEYA